MALKVELGRKYSAADAKAIVDKLYSIVRERWEVKVNQTPFMQQFMAGKLPLKVLQTFSQLGRVHDRDQHAHSVHRIIETLLFQSKSRSDGADRRERSPMSSFTPSRRAIFSSCCKPRRLSA